LPGSPASPRYLRTLDGMVQFAPLMTGYQRTFDWNGRSVSRGS
jgi:hypothetical protein